MRADKTTLLCLLLGALCACATGGANGDPPAGTDESSVSIERPPGVTAEQLAELERSVADAPEDPSAHQRFGRALRDAQRNDESVAQFERAVELAPDDTRLKLDLALAYSMAGQFDRAEAIYDQLVTIPELTALALHNKGNLALRRDQLDRAIELYRQALGVKPDYLLALYHLGVALERKGELRDAYRSFGQVLKLEPPGDPAAAKGYIDSLYRMGKLDVQMGATQRGAELLAELLETDPEHPEAHYQYAQALMRLGRQQEAEQHFRMHMELLKERQPGGPASGE
jgi:tetratricopeptide (TPR) repeat protein